MTETPTADLRPFDYVHTPRPPCPHRHRGYGPSQPTAVADWAVTRRVSIVIAADPTQPGPDRARACTCRTYDLTAPDGTTARILTREPNAFTDAQDGNFRRGNWLTPLLLHTHPGEELPAKTSLLHHLHALITGRATTLNGWTADPESLAALLDWYHPLLATHADDIPAWSEHLTPATAMRWVTETPLRDPAEITAWAKGLTPEQANAWLAVGATPALARDGESFTADLTHTAILDLLTHHHDAFLDATLTCTRSPAEARHRHLHEPDRGNPLPDTEPRARSPRGLALLHLTSHPHLSVADAHDLTLAGITPAEATRRISDGTLDMDTVRVLAALA